MLSTSELKLIADALKYSKPKASYPEAQARHDTARQLVEAEIARREKENRQ